MDENTVLIQDPFTLEERVYSFCGIWPLKQAYVKFLIYFTYFTIYVGVNVAVFIDVLGDLELMLINLRLTTALIIAYPMSILVRYNTLLPQLISAIKKDIATDRFNDTEETSMYFGYNHLSITFTNVAISGGLTVATLLYISPLKQLIHFDSSENESLPFVLPFGPITFINVSDFRIYILLYIYQIPTIYVGLTHTCTVCLIVTLILHVCGRLSILSHRIRNITVKDKRQWHDAIRRVVKTHLKLIWMAKSINDVFHLVLLIELTVSCIRLSLYTYVLITHMQISDLTIIFTFIIYVTMMLLILFAYCFTGEQLIQESKNLQAAYYHCNWEQMPKGCRTSLLICMIYAQKSYYLTAGKFYIFSLYGFTDVVKTSMAYVSMLQSFT